MKALTVQQPWAWAIMHGGKDVENRSQLWSYRGQLAIHAGKTVSQDGMVSDLVQRAAQVRLGLEPPDTDAGCIARGLDPMLGYIIGVVDLVDVHRERPRCCPTSPWAEHDEPPQLGQIVHLVLEHPSPLARPVPCRGWQSLWKVAPGVDHQVYEQLEAPR